MLKKAILTIAGALAVTVLAVPAASASTTTAAQPSCYGPAVARCLVITLATTTPPGLKYQDAGPPVHYHT